MTDHAALPLGSEMASTASPSFSGWSGSVNSGPGLVKAWAGQQAPATWVALLLSRCGGDQLPDALLCPAVQRTDLEPLAMFLLLGYLIASGLLVGWTLTRLSIQLGLSRVALYLHFSRNMLASLRLELCCSREARVSILDPGFLGR